MSNVPSRIANTVRRVEALPYDSTGKAGGTSHAPIQGQTVRVTGSPSVGPGSLNYYPGIICLFDRDAGTWSDVADATVWLVEPGGSALSTRRYGHCRPMADQLTISSDTRPLLEVNAGGGGCDTTINEFLGICFTQDNNVNSAPAAGTSPIILTTFDRNLSVDASSGNVVVHLPPANVVTSQEFHVEKIDNSANVVVIVRGDAAPFTGSQGGTIRAGEVDIVLRDQFDSSTFYKEVSGPTAGEAMGVSLTGLTYAGPVAEWRLKDSVGGSFGPPQPVVGMVMGCGLTGLTY